MNTDVHAPARRRDWGLYQAVKTALSFLSNGASSVDVYAALMELGVGKHRAAELVAGVNVR